MKIILSAILLVMLLSVTTIAQPTIVHKVTGELEYNNNGNWTKLQPGQQVYGNTWIRAGKQKGCFVLKKDEYYCLHDMSMGNSVQVKTLKFLSAKGSVKDLAKGLSNSVASKGKSGTAAIYRGKSLMLFPAHNEILTSQPDFIWESGDRNSFNFYLTEPAMKGEWICISERVGDTILRPGTKGRCDAITFSTGKKYLWTINPADDENDEAYFISFTLADEQTQQKLKSSLAELEPYKSDDKVYSLLAGALYEELRMFSNAYHIYVDAAKKNPGSSLVEGKMNDLLIYVSSLNQPKK